MGGGVAGGGGAPAPRKNMCDIETERLGFNDKPDYFSLRCMVPSTPCALHSEPCTLHPAPCTQTRNLHKQTSRPRSLNRGPDRSRAMQHLSTSHSQILASAFSPKSPNPLEWLPSDSNSGNM